MRIEKRICGLMAEGRLEVELIPQDVEEVILRIKTFLWIDAVAMSVEEKEVRNMAELLEEKQRFIEMVKKADSYFLKMVEGVRRILEIE